MKIGRLSWQSYRIPFRHPFTTSHGVLAVREGILLTLEASEGSWGLGDAAPMAAFGGGDVAAVDRMLREMAPALVGLDVETLASALNLIVEPPPTDSPPSRRSSRAVKALGNAGRSTAGFFDDVAGPSSSRPISSMTPGTPSGRMTANSFPRGPDRALPTGTMTGDTRSQVAEAANPLSLIDGGVGASSSAAQVVARLQGPGAASLRCALETACLDVLARAAGVTLAAYLAPGVHIPRSVPLNATVTALAIEEAADAAARAVEVGFGCVKLKVGMLATPAEEAGRVAAVRDAMGPETALRLDANGAWDVDQAIATIHACEPYDLEMIEQPVSPRSIDDLARVHAAVRTPIAADEALVDPLCALEVIRRRAADVLVLKPMALGGIGPARRLAILAHQAGLRSIVTTTLDSGVGIAAALHLAACLPPPLSPCGLATAALLESDLLVRSIEVSGGSMRLPDEPGLGVTLCETTIARYAGPFRGEAGSDGSA